MVKKITIITLAAVYVFAIAPCPIHNYETASFGAKLAAESLLSQKNNEMRNKLQKLIKNEKNLNALLKKKLLISKRVRILYENILLEKEKQVFELKKIVKELSLQINKH